MMAMDPRDTRRTRPEAVPGRGGDPDLDGLLALVARGDESAFVAVYSRLAGWLPRLALAAATAGVVAAVVLAVILVGTRHRLGIAQAQNRAIAGVLAAPDARVLTRSTSAGGTATVIVSPSERELIVTTAGLRSLPASKVYQAWLINPRRTRPAGLLPAPSGGRTRPLLATGLLPGDELGLTVEPAGGTTKPTTTPILVIPLRA